MLLQMLGLVMKCTDMFVDYSKSLYHLFQNEMVFLFIGIGIYLTIWSKMYREILSLDQPRCSRLLFLSEIVTFSIMGVYFFLSILLLFVEADMGAFNNLQGFTFFFLSYLFVSFNFIGFSLLMHIKKISMDVYSSSRKEITLNIVFNCGFLLVRLIIESIELFNKEDVSRWQNHSCLLKNDTWAYFIIICQGTSIGSILGYVLFLNLTGLRHTSQNVRQQSQDFSYMRFMMKESEPPVNDEKQTAFFHLENNDDNSFVSSQK